MNKILLVLSMVLLGCSYSDPLKEIKRVYLIPLEQEIGVPKKVVFNNDEGDGTFILEYSREALEKLTTVTDKYGYNAWQKLPEGLSHGNRSVVVDGYYSRDVVFTEKLGDRCTYRIFVNFYTNQLIMFVY